MHKSSTIKGYKKTSEVMFVHIHALHFSSCLCTYVCVYLYVLFCKLTLCYSRVDLSEQLK